MEDGKVLILMRNIELLAPAGSYEAFIAAVQNGADAVYLGGRNFGARAYAQNFNMETLERAIDYAHLRGVKIYVTINTLIKDYETLDAIEYISKLYSLGVDAIIVQDLGVINLVKKFFPDFEVHCSTQMALHNSAGIMELQKMGVKRVVLARELSIKDIKTIQDRTQIELEVFAHGALCYSYSGLCLMSSFIGGRSGNRGRCAQPCRKAYEIISLDSRDIKSEKAYYISTRDLKTIEQIGEIIESGIKSLKIEGRMKNPEYVAAVVRTYRRAIDNYLAYGQNLYDEVGVKEITQIFNREFTRGYLLESPQGEFLNPNKPSNKGLLLGRVAAYDSVKKRVKIKVLDNINQGDGIWVSASGHKGIGGIVNKIYTNNRLTHRAVTGDIVEIEFEGNISRDDEIYKTLDSQLMKDLQSTYNESVENRKIKIDGEARLKENNPLKLYIWDIDGNTVYVESGVKAEKAKKVALSEEKLRENLKKFGNTPFDLENIKISLESNVSLPISAVNKTRRKAADELIKIRINKSKRSDKVIDNSKMFPLPISKNMGQEKKISVKVENIEHLHEVVKFNINRVYFPNPYLLERAIKICRDRGVELYYRSPAILKDKEHNQIKDILVKNLPDGILAGELGMVDFAKKTLNIPVFSDYTLNAINSNTISFLANMGLDGISISPELELDKIKRLMVEDDLEIESIIYGKIPVMISETCPLVTTKQCDNMCDSCGLEPFQYKWGLQDEKKAVFPFTKDNWGRTIILNNYPIYMMDKMKDFDGSIVTTFRIDFTDEDIIGVRTLMKDYINIFSFYNKMGSKKDSLHYNKKINKFTRGHYYRGVE